MQNGGHTSMLLESLESRQLMSAVPAQSQLIGPPLPPADHAPLATTVAGLNGSYSGTLTITVGGKMQNIPTTVIISKNGTQLKLKIPYGPFTFKPSCKLHFTTTGADFGATLPKSLGDGKVQIDRKGHMDIDGTVDPGISPVVPFSFSGSQAAGAAAPSAIAVTAAKSKKNPIVGDYKGTMILDTDNSSIPAAAQFINNKLGHPVAHVQMEVVDFGEVDIDILIHAHSTGSFTQMLTTLPTDGSLSGHITHTGKLSLELFIPHIPFITTLGSLKRIA